MYLELTNACNMRCEHCCMNAVKHTGRAARYMSREVIEAAYKLASEFGEDITLGGGEPTLHPDFAFALGIAMLHAGDLGVLCITNGSNAHITERMLHLSDPEGMFHCEVSEDWFHDRTLVEDRIYLLATKKKMIRNTSRHVIAQGRGRNLSEEIACVCQTAHVSWDGTVHLCGCRRKKDRLGNVLTDFDLIVDKINDLGGYECNGRRIIRS